MVLKRLYKESGVMRSEAVVLTEAPRLHTCMHAHLHACMRTCASCDACTPVCMHTSMYTCASCDACSTVPFWLHTGQASLE